MPKSLWPDTIGTVEEVPPVAILKQQAALLGEKTKNIVIAEVDSKAGYNNFYDVFYLVAPALDNYSFELFKVSRSIENFYPVTISSDTLIYDNQITSEAQLLKALENIFSNSKTVKIIQSMLAQSGWEPEIPF
jgi:hypothetical protein